jgi:hypothetical protein
MKPTEAERLSGVWAPGVYLDETPPPLEFGIWHEGEPNSHTPAFWDPKGRRIWVNWVYWTHQALEGYGGHRPLANLHALIHEALHAVGFEHPPDRTTSEYRAVVKRTRQAIPKQVRLEAELYCGSSGP